MGKFGRIVPSFHQECFNHAIHLAILSWVLTSKFIIQSTSPPISFSIEIAELTPLPEALMPDHEKPAIAYGEDDAALRAYLAELRSHGMRILLLPRIVVPF